MGMGINSRISFFAVVVLAMSLSTASQAGFSLKKSSGYNEGPAVRSSKVDAVEQQTIDSVISKIKADIKKPGGSDQVDGKLVEEDLVTGFGSDLPLLISLQQIIPAKYQFSLGEGVDTNLITSWEGGDKWENVLRDMLTKYNLVFDVSANVVTIKNITASLPKEEIKKEEAVVLKEPKVDNKEEDTKVSKNKAVSKKSTIKDKVKKLVASAKKVVSDTGKAIDNVNKQKEETAESLLPDPDETVLISSVVPEKKEVKREIKKEVVNKNKKIARLGQRVPVRRPANLVKEDSFASLYGTEYTYQKGDIDELENKSNAPMNILMIRHQEEFQSQERPEFEYSPEVDLDTPWRMAKAKWVGHRDQTLKEVLEEWCEEEGVQLYWAMDYDYRLNRDIAFSGEYEAAVARLIDVFAGLRPQPYGQLHKGSRGPLVLVVNSYDLAH